MSKLLSQGGFGCVYYPGIACNGKRDPRKTIVTKLQKSDFNASNEVYIGGLIKKIPDYELFYLPVIESCPVNIRNIDRELITECQVVAKSQDVPFVLMSIPYVSNRGFFDVVTDRSLGRKQVISTLARTYSYLLTAIENLINIKVVQFDLKGENILYNLVTKDPQIIDFGISLPISKIDPQNWSKYFYAYAPEYHVWPLEVHLINFLLHVSSPLSAEDIPNIVKPYTNRNKALTLFSSDFREKYSKLCEVCLKEYVGKAKEKAIPELISNYATWDNYSLGVLYLKALARMFPQGVKRNKVIVRFTQMLVLNISPVTTSRLSLAETRKQFENVFFEGGDMEDYEDLVDSIEYDSELATHGISEDIAKPRVTAKPPSV
jgi:serine/threonine protein kinase